ncbi:DUF2125 domain-containing protein [Lichenicoccus sp.]|uniref:DUF2125 domain-containing protein n=1 Tax=Lichenicoccus sp. TaxID=2781899 RepID=UPI003D0F78FF
MNTGRRGKAGGRLWGALVLAGLLLAADSLLWLRMQRMLSQRLEALRDTAASHGWRLEIAQGGRGGWPWAATLDLPLVRLRGAPALLPTTITWSGERLIVSLSLAHPRRMTVLAHGTQTLSFGDRGDLPRVRFWGGEIALHLPAWSHQSHVATFDARALHVARAGAGPDDVLTAASLAGSVRWTADAQAVRLAVDAIGLPRDAGTATSQVVPGVTLAASLSGDGRLLLQEAALRWKDAQVILSGAATLPRGGNGAFSVHIVGADALLSMAATAGILTPRAASTARAVLALITSAGGVATGPVVLPPLDLPLGLHDGVLSLGRIPLLRLPSPEPAPRQQH